MHLFGWLFCSFRVSLQYFKMLKVMQFPRCCKCIDLSNVGKLPTFSVANVAGPSAYEVAELSVLRRFAVALKMRAGDVEFFRGVASVQGFQSVATGNP